MSRLPEKLDPIRAADQGRRLQGAFALAELPRVAAALNGLKSEAVFELEFFRDSKRRPCVRGDVKVSVLMDCQRCLEPVILSVDSEILIALVQGVDEAQQLPEEYDPFLLEEETLNPAELIEDEIILALPQIPVHDECRIPDWGGGVDVAPEKADESDDDNPFKVLAQLKKQIH